MENSLPTCSDRPVTTKFEHTWWWEPYGCCTGTVDWDGFWYRQLLSYTGEDIIEWSPEMGSKKAHT